MAIDPALRVRLLLSLAFEVDTIDLARALSFADAAVAIVDTTPTVLSPDLIACSRLQRASLRFQFGRGDDVEDVRVASAGLGSAPRIGPDGDEEREGLRAHVLVWQWATDHDDLAAARAGAEADLQRCLDRGLDRPLPISASDVARLDLLAGDLAAAEGHAAVAMAAADRVLGSHQARIAGLTALAQVAAHQGRLAEARILASEALAVAAEIDGWETRRVYQTLGFVELSDELPSVAIGHLEPLWRSDVAAKRPVSIGERYVGDLVEAGCAAGAIELATGVLATIEADLRISQRPWARLVAARGRALIAVANGDLDLAAIEVARATEIAAGLPMPFERGRTALLAGRIARRRRERRIAREHLGQAREIFAGLGASAWQAMAEADLARLGRRTAALDDLTETEARAAHLAADGRTNREIGDQLFLTPKSVEGVLGRVYGKLGIRRRAELASRLAARADD